LNAKKTTANPLTWTATNKTKRWSQNSESPQKLNERKTQYCGHLSSHLLHVWTWPHLRVGIFLYMGGWSQRTDERVDDLMECGLCPTSDGLPSGVFSTLVSVLFGFWIGFPPPFCSMPLTMSRTQRIMSRTWGGGLHPWRPLFGSSVEDIFFDERVWGEVFSGVLGEASRGIEGFWREGAKRFRKICWDGKKRSKPRPARGVELLNVFPNPSLGLGSLYYGGGLFDIVTLNLGLDPVCSLLSIDGSVR